MKVKLMPSRCEVTREKGDPRVKNDSQLLHQVKKQLIGQGHDVVKKLMYKDGHLVDEHEHYIRARHPQKLEEGDLFCIWNSHYALRDVATEYNRFDTVRLNVERV